MCAIHGECPVLCEPMDCSLPGSSGPWGFSRQEYSIQGSNPRLMSPASAGGFFITSATWEAQEN